MRRNKVGTVLIVLGVICICVALCLTVGNLFTQQRADESAQMALNSLKELIPKSPAAEPEQILSPEETAPTPQETVEIPDYVLNPAMDMPEAVIDGVSYIGYLEIPALELQLPIISQTSYPGLKIAPCRYQGSVYLNDLVIGAHNYARHFGNIGKLSYGDEVKFTDMDGNVFRYQVVNIEILQPNQVDDLCSGEWPLTLYTCTLGGRTRVTVRCEMTGE